MTSPKKRPKDNPYILVSPKQQSDRHNFSTKLSINKPHSASYLMSLTQYKKAAKITHLRKLTNIKE